MASVDIYARTDGCKLQIHVERDGPLVELIAEAYGLLLAGAKGMPDNAEPRVGSTPDTGSTA